MTRRILVLDSGVGGVGVADAIRVAVPDATLVCVADHAFYPYGGRDDDVLARHLDALVASLLPALRPDLLVLGCNTASTIALDALRARFAPLPIVGCVPPVRPAASLSRTRVIGLLATAATVRRDYVRTLRDRYAPDCTLVAHGARGLADIAEAIFVGAAPPHTAIATEIGRLFDQPDGRLIDAVCLGCTHYRLLRPLLESLAPRPVWWLDPAEGVARRVAALLAAMPDGDGAAAGAPGGSLLLTTGRHRDPDAFARGAARRGFEQVADWTGTAIRPWTRASADAA